MLETFFSILPIFITIFIGWLLKHTKLINEMAVRINNSLVYNIFLPSLLIYKISLSNLSKIFSFKLILALYLSVFIGFIISIITANITKISQDQKGSFLINSFRGNFAYMGLPVAYFLFSNKGLLIGSILIAFIVPFVNTLSIFALSISKKPNFKKAIKEAILSPIAVASVIGILITLSKINLPNIILESLKILSQPSLTLALIGIGASLKLENLSENLKPIAISTILKLIVLPAIGIGILHLVNLESIQKNILLIMLASPPATLNYIMAHQFKSDETLASTGICITTIISFISYALWIFIFIK